MKRGTTLNIQLVDKQGTPLLIADVSVDVVLYCGGKERYRFDAGTTDHQGRVSTSYNNLEQVRNENEAFAVMDYNTKLEDCDDKIGLAVPTIDQLRQRLAAVRKWFPENELALSERIKKSKNDSIASSGIKAILTNGSNMDVQLPVN